MTFLRCALRLVSPPTSRTVLLSLLAATLLACADGSAAPTPPAPPGVDTSDELATAPDQTPADCPETRPSLCERAGDDAVRDVFCGAATPAITGLRELEQRLGLETFSLSAAQLAAIDPDAVVDSVVFLGHSTALSGQLVSPLNPRAIVIGAETLLAFQRGIQQVEIASYDRGRGTLNFYLVHFEQACNRAGCTPGDLYTPRVESDWTNVRIEDDEQLKNTPSDCRQCHQRARDQPVLLMRELKGPWVHFFEPDPDGDSYQPSRGVTGRDLTRDFVRAKGDERYAGLPAVIARHTSAFFLQNAVDTAQPLEFDSAQITDERGIYLEPNATKPLARSATWQASYDAFKRGEQLAPPHFEGRPTDLTKQTKLSQAYERFRSGQLPASALPDLADIFPDDPQTRAEIGLQTEPGAAPPDALIQACGSCHNDVLDQTISRARFNIALGRMSRAALDLAIARIEQSASAPGAMPPPSTRQLDAKTKTALLAYLRGRTRPSQDDARLARAAERGMVGSTSQPFVP